jgi:hypothetical protein
VVTSAHELAELRGESLEDVNLRPYGPEQFSGREVRQAAGRRRRARATMWLDALRTVAGAVVTMEAVDPPAEPSFQRPGSVRQPRSARRRCTEDPRKPLAWISCQSTCAFWRPWVHRSYRSCSYGLM